MTTYIAKIPEFNREDIETSSQEWLNQVTKAGDANRWNAARMLKTIPYFLKETAEEWFENLAAPFNDWNTFKAAFLEQRIRQLETNNYYSDAQILDQFIAGLKDKLIKKVCSHAPEDLNSVIQHAKRYKMVMEEANHTKLVNLAIGETSSAAEEKIDQLTKKVENYFTNQQQQQPQRYQPPQRQNQNNFAPLSNNQPQNCHYYQQNRSNQRYPPSQQSYYQLPPPAYYPPRPQYQNNYYQPAPQPISQQYQQLLTQHYQVPARRLLTQNQFTPQNRYQANNNRISLNNQLVLQNTTQPRLNHYHTQPSYLTMLEEQDFHHTALSKGRAAAQQQNPSYTPTTIPLVRIAKNTNLSDIFPFEFKANELPFLLSNAAANEQKAITAMYTEAEVEGKTIHLILDSGSARSIITYQLMQQLKKNVDRPAQTVIVTADGMKKTPVGEIDNFPFTLDGITIPVKVLVMDAPHIFNKCSEKAPAFEFELEEEKPLIETFMALGSMFNWANETEQEHFTPHSEPKTSGWNILYSKSEPRKQCPYIPLKCKNCHKKLSSMGACISPEEEYENHTFYYCKACHRE
ncbi:hypothetical protein G9A89_007627 [Geosiphon pyriformis]|nr:hypothetical protein G9A89_007627 [Geosiphon pyriformis]